MIIKNVEIEHESEMKEDEAKPPVIKAMSSDEKLLYMISLLDKIVSNNNTQKTIEILNALI